MTTSRWWRGAVIYQIYPRSFLDTNGDGVGDLPGIIDKLDYVASLGVDAIWISPFFKSPMADFGYDIADYRDVDPMFGTLADFDRLLARAHSLGLKVMIDQVLSHTSIEHDWFKESRESRDNPKADWFVWADAKPDGTPPNNWLGWWPAEAPLHVDRVSPEALLAYERRFNRAAALASLADDFEQVRAATLGRPRAWDALRHDVEAMRLRMRGELDRSDTAAFDLKQGEGGLVDLEFLLQALVLGHAHADASLLEPRDTPGLIAALQGGGRMAPDTAAALTGAHGQLLALGLACTLDRRARRVPADAAVDAARAAIRAGLRAHALEFGVAPR